MTASKDERSNIEAHLPHDMLKELYLNSRVSIKELERKFGISHHTLSKCLKECEEKYGLTYTLDIDTSRLGFSEPRIITVKFQESVPEIELLKKTLEKDPFVQNAYLAAGDFDLILHIVAFGQANYIGWLFGFRVKFSHYKPVVKVVTLDDVAEGFMPINSIAIKRSDVINESEKALLLKLTENSRKKVKHLAKETGLSQMKIIYLMKSLYDKKIIRKFTTCIQRPDKRIWMFFTISLMPSEDHKPQLQTRLINEIARGEDERGITTDYSVVYDTSGHFDSVLFCNFKSGIELEHRGPGLFDRLWKTESPKFEKAMLISIITGILPFNKNSYVEWTALVNKENTKIKKIEPF